MPDIYTEGALDYEKAAKLLAGIKGRTPTAQTAADVDLVTAGAMLDIAVSLSAIVTGLATGGIWTDEADLGLDDEREVGPDGEPLGDPDRGIDEPIDVGDWVIAKGTADPLGDAAVRVLALSTSEDREVATLSTGVKAWVDELTLAPLPVASVVLDAEGFDLDDDEDGDDLADDFGQPAETTKKSKTKKKGK